jgi:hypothetical protein
MSRLGLGWKEDAPDVRDFDNAERFGGPAVAFSPASLRAYKQGELYQNGFGACVAFALARAIHMALLVADERAGRPLSASMPSPMFMYYNARRQETVEAREDGRPDLPVIDKGSFPRLAMRAVQNIGFCREQDYPFADGAADINGFPNDNRRPPPRAYMSAFDQRNLVYRRIYAYGAEARAREVARCLAAGSPVIFGMTVDEAFMDNDGPAVIDSVDLSKKVGGHMLLCLDADDTGPGIDNWWSSRWRQNGEARLTWDLFAQDHVRDLYAIDVVPAFSSEAP